MTTHGVIGTAVSMLTLCSCIYPEPIVETPPPVDNAPAIVQAFPNAHQVFYTFDSSSNLCTVDVGLTTVSSPLEQPLFAQFYLNFDQSPTSPGTLVTVGQSTAPLALTQTGNATNYSLQRYKLPLANFAQALFALGSSEPANELTVFVSDGFNPANPSLPLDSSHYVTSWDWQVVVTDASCIDQLNDLLR